MSKSSFEGAEKSPISGSIVRRKNFKTFSEISCYNLDLVEEEIKLLENRQTKQYKFTVVVAKTLLGILSFKLDSFKYGDSSLSKGNERFSPRFVHSTTRSEEKLMNFLRFRNPLEGLSLKVRSMKMILLYSILPYLIGSYISIKFILMTYYQAEYNFFESEIIPKFREGAIITGLCCFEKDRYKTHFDEQMFARFEYAKAWLESLNNPIMTGSGSALALIGIIGTLPLMVYLTGVASVLVRRRRVDVIHFYLNPMGEISRIKKELTDIILRASRSLENYRYNIRVKIESSKLNYTEKTNFEPTHNSNNLNSPKTYLNYPNMFKSNLSSGKIEIPINHKSNLSNYGSLSLSNKLSNKTYNQMLFNVNLVEMVRPANLTSKWHKTLTKLETLSSFLDILANVSHTVPILAISIINELHRRVEQRLSLLKCQKWKPGAVLIRETMKLSPLNKREDILAYSAYDGSTLKLFKLITQVEINYNLTRGIIFSLLQIFAAMTILILMSSFFYWLNVRAFLSRLIWLNQMEEQVKWCATHLDQLKMESEKEIITNQKFIFGDHDQDEIFETNSEKLIMESTPTPTTTTQKRNSSIYQEDKESDIAAVVRAVLVTYLNYELYRKQQAEYSKLTTFLLIHILTMIIVASLITYFVGIQSNSNFSKLFILLLPTYLMVFVNIHLLTGAIILSKNSKLTKSIFKLLAAGTRKKLQLLDLIDLWRRQLLDDERTKKTYAVNLFSVYFSYDSIITLDGYLLVLWFVLLSGRTIL